MSVFWGSVVSFTFQLRANFRTILQKKTDADLFQVDVKGDDMSALYRHHDSRQLVLTMPNFLVNSPENAAQVF